MNDRMKKFAFTVMANMRGALEISFPSSSTIGNNSFESKNSLANYKTLKIGKILIFF